MTGHFTRIKYLLSCLLMIGISLFLSACDTLSDPSYNLNDIPPFDGSRAYVALKDNMPNFNNDDRAVSDGYEAYSALDHLGRSGTAFAKVGTETMPTTERGSIGQVKPTGWQTIRYDHINGKYLYNRCHLIGYQLTAENANERNLITGTRYLNIEGMLPFENMVADYIKETGNHVLYRVTPLYRGDDLLASGVQIEAESLEDHGEAISFNVYCYNNQPGVQIDYATGESCLSQNNSISTDPITAQPASEESTEKTYILNTNTHKFHYPSCTGVRDSKVENRETFLGLREDLIDQGYTPCKRCNP